MIDQEEFLPIKIRNNKRHLKAIMKKYINKQINIFMLMGCNHLECLKAKLLIKMKLKTLIKQ